MKLTPTDHETFKQKGILHLKGVIPKKICVAAQAAILKQLDQAGLRTKGKLVSSKINHLPLFQQTGYLAQKIRIEAELSGLFSHELLEVMDALAGTRLKAAHASPQLLLSFPHKKDWDLSALNWHLDKAVPERDEISGVQAFALLGELRPHGGATLALAGSHRLPYLNATVHPPSAVPTLRAHPVFKNLFEGAASAPEIYFRPQPVGGVDVQIVEMHGQAGDVYLMDMRVLHSPSLNATPHLRMMATNRFIR